MNAQLNADVVPALRSRGFRGSLPHFRRITDAGVDLITFQFRLAGGSFVVEVAYKAPYTVTSQWGDHVPPEKLTAHDLNKRKRIGRAVLNRDDPWFDFSAGSYDEVARQVIAALLEAESYWAERRNSNSEPPEPPRAARS